MASYYAENGEHGAHEKLCVQIGYGMSGGWSWAVEIATGEIYDAAAEFGTRLKRLDEVVDREDLIWRVLMHGRAATQKAAKEAAAAALASLGAVMATITSDLAKEI